MVILAHVVLIPGTNRRSSMGTITLTGKDKYDLDRQQWDWRPWLAGVVTNRPRL
jgi:hypothetical protein